MARPKKWTMTQLAEIFILSDKEFQNKYNIKDTNLKGLQKYYGIKRKRRAPRVSSESPSYDQTVQK